MTLRERLARQPPKASLAMPLRGLADMAARPLRPAGDTHRGGKQVPAE
jgi:hypothetical protein